MDKNIFVKCFVRLFYLIRENIAFAIRPITPVPTIHRILLTFETLSFKSINSSLCLLSSSTTSLKFSKSNKILCCFSTAGSTVFSKNFSLSSKFFSSPATRVTMPIFCPSPMSIKWSSPIDDLIEETSSTNLSIFIDKSVECFNCFSTVSIFSFKEASNWTNSNSFCKIKSSIKQRRGFYTLPM